MPQTNESSLLLGEGGGRRGERAGDNLGGRAIDNTVVDVPGVIHGRGCIHRRELVEGGDLGLRHVAGRGAWGRRGPGNAIEDGGVTYRGTLWATTPSTRTKTSKNGWSIRYVNHMITSMDTDTDMEIFQINLLNFASLMMLLYTLSRGLSPALPMGLDLTKKGMLPAWRTSLLR